VLHDAKAIADRVVRMVQDGAVVSVTGKVIKMRTDTVCIHGDTHGALSNVACEDDMTAKAIAAGIRAVDPSLIFVVLANSKLVRAGEEANLPMVHEVFADRAYEDDGNLVSRKKPGAVLHDAKAIADRVVRMVQDGAVVSVTGKVIKMRTDTVCIHGDTHGAVEIARTLRQSLKDAGIEVTPFKRGA